MDDLFHKRVRAAAIAGWWTLLVAIIIHLLALSGLLCILHHHPAWVTGMWGNIGWDTIQNVGIWMIAIYRVIVWVLVLIVVWLSLWARRLKRIQ
jgi:hypothetical protein